MIKSKIQLAQYSDIGGSLKHFTSEEAIEGLALSSLLLYSHRGRTFIFKYRMTHKYTMASWQTSITHLACNVLVKNRIFIIN